MIRIKRNEPLPDGIPEPAKPKRTRGPMLGTSIQVRLQPDMLKQLDRYRGHIGGTRPEAIRRLIEKGLT